jgi:hypothetical protein
MKKTPCSLEAGKNCQGAMLSESERNRDKEERRKKKERS